MFHSVDARTVAELIFLCIDNLYLASQEIQSSERARRTAEGERDELQDELSSTSSKM